MPDPAQPESPPVKIRYGGASIAGAVGAAGAAIPLIIDALTDERLDPRTRVALIVCVTVLLLAFMAGRFWQAVTAEKTRSQERVLAHAAKDIR